MAKRETLSWKHVKKVRKQYQKYWEGERIRTTETLFMSDVDEDVWAMEMAYGLTDDGCPEE